MDVEAAGGILTHLLDPLGGAGKCSRERISRRELHVECVEYLFLKVLTHLETVKRGYYLFYS